MKKIGDNCDAHIYFIGAICHDIILHVDEYPSEDGKIATSKVERRRGGNSGNSLEVICQLNKNKKMYFLGAFGGKDQNLLAQDLLKRGVSLEFSVFRTQVENSSSWIISTGKSRTIINYNPVQDMDWQEFSKCLSSLHPSQNWFHFEGRNIEETHLMITHLRKNAAHPITISVEFEKGDRPNIDSLIPLADVLFFSSYFAKKRGYDSGLQFLQNYLDSSRKVKSRALMFCSWGGVGSCGKEVGSSEGESSSCVYFADAPPGIIPVDSVGAGDTWIASIIYHLSNGVDWRDALKKSTWIASQKIGMNGFNLVSLLPSDHLPDRGDS